MLISLPRRYQLPIYQHPSEDNTLDVRACLDSGASYPSITNMNLASLDLASLDLRIPHSGWVTSSPMF